MILAPPDSPLTVPLAVAATRSGDHAGVVYLWPQTGAAFFFHHIGEDDLRHESADMTRLRWARPALATDELEDVAARASLLDDMYTAQGIGLPYGFDRDLGFDEDGRLVSVDPDAGLTCATFVSPGALPRRRAAGPTGARRAGGRVGLRRDHPAVARAGGGGRARSRSAPPLEAPPFG